jgi:hypothetical protein
LVIVFLFWLRLPGVKINKILNYASINQKHYQIKFLSKIPFIPKNSGEIKRPPFKQSLFYFFIIRLSLSRLPQHLFCLFRWLSNRIVKLMVYNHKTRHLRSESYQQIFVYISSLQLFIFIKYASM